MEHPKFDFSETYIWTEDFFLTGERFELKRDEKFDLLKTFPIPEKLEEYYQHESYRSHSDNPKSLFDRVYGLVKNISLKKKIRLIENCAPNSKRLLDVGTGTGDFLLEAKKAGWETFGIEPVGKARERAESKGIRVIDDLKGVDGKFDVITLWHVLEHIPNLPETITTLETLLEPQGILIIVVPNFRSYDATKFGRFWAAYDVPRHIWHFSRKSIMMLFQEKFVLNKEMPMWFDAFYISMMSQKYKSGIRLPFSALFIGLLSNLKALKTGEFSSVLYILSKK